MKIAADLGFKEYQNDLELAKCAVIGYVAPVSAYVVYQVRILEEMSKGKIDGEKIKELTKERDELLSAFANAPKD